MLRHGGRSHKYTGLMDERGRGACRVCMTTTTFYSHVSVFTSFLSCENNVAQKFTPRHAICEFACIRG